MEPWIFMCLSWFSVSGTLLHAWSHSTFFPHFAGWKKKHQGQSKGFMPLYTQKHTHTHFQWNLCPRLTLAWSLPHVNIFENSVLPCVILHPPFTTWILLTNQSAEQSEKRTALLMRQRDGWHSCDDDDDVFTPLAADILFTWNVWLLAKDFVSYNDTEKRITTRMWQAYQLCPNIWSSLRERVGRRAECVTPLQRVCREMNGADILRGPRTARLTDFISVNGTCFGFASLFSLTKRHSHADIISMHCMSIGCFSLFTASHC